MTLNGLSRFAGRGNVGLNGGHGAPQSQWYPLAL